MKPNKIPLVWNIIISAVAVIGLAFCAIRFAMAIEDGLMTKGISHWDINDDWLEFENNNLLNDN